MHSAFGCFNLGGVAMNYGRFKDDSESGANVKKNHKEFLTS